MSTRRDRQGLFFFLSAYSSARLPSYKLTDLLSWVNSESKALWTPPLPRLILSLKPCINQTLPRHFHWLTTSIDTVRGPWIKSWHFRDLAFGVSNGQKTFVTKTVLEAWNPLVGTDVFHCGVHRPVCWQPGVYARSAMLGFFQAAFVKGGVQGSFRQ